MFLTDKYPGCKFAYTALLLRAIEADYFMDCYEGIDIFYRGSLLYSIRNPLSIAECRCDYERACQHIGKKAGKRASYNQLRQMINFLNGVKHES